MSDKAEQKPHFLPGKIVPYFQPIYCVKSDTIEKFECLARMIDDNDRILLPANFLPQFKIRNQYDKITRAILSLSLSIFSKRTEEFTINIATEDMENPHTISFIGQQLLHFPDKHRLIFEIVEFSDKKHMQSVLQFIQRCRAWGCQVALDDFGKGVVALEDLSALDLDYIKVDGQITKNIKTDPKAKATLEALVAYSKKNKIKTIAEYVESQDIFNTVVDYGLDFLQGYYIGEPNPEPYTNFLRSED